jgi:hypothetical protein
MRIILESLGAVTAIAGLLVLGALLRPVVFPPSAAPTKAAITSLTPVECGGGSDKTAPRRGGE